MSFLGYKDFIEETDTVVLYINASTMYSIEVLSTIKNKHGKPVENVFQTSFGALKVKDLIGVKFGSKVKLSRGWAYVLHPTPEMWTVTLPHRTQIIYTPDISMILMQLELCPGAVVIESGTGSGSLTHALARAVGPSGHVHTFDFHQGRVDMAIDEFSRHGISGIVTVKHRDACADGFGPELDGCADAVFLDLPHPWIAIPHAVKAFKSSGGRFCSFSPCIEQVQKTCMELHKVGFLELTTVECLQRELNVVNRTLPTLNIDMKEEGEKFQCVMSSYGSTSPGHTGYLTFCSLPPVCARGYYRQEGRSEDLEMDLSSNNNKSPDLPGAIESPTPS